MSANTSGGPSAGSAAVAVSLRGVWKVYTDGTAAVRDLDLDISRGEFFSLLGPSGCGKTTTLRMVAGFEQPTAGTIELAGKAIQAVPPHQRDVNTVFQSYALFPHLSVFENVAYGLRRKKVPKPEVTRRVGEILELVQLSGLAKRRPEQLSGGQQQRVALARALVNRPAVLLLDEPLGALDLKLRKQMQIELSRIQREVGITFVYVTHDQEEALTMSDRLAVMNGGRFEQVGAPWDIYEQPASAFVAGFIGTSNVLRAKVRELSGQWALLEAPLDGVRVPAAGLVPGDLAEFTVRPEKVELCKPASVPSDDRCRVGGVVTDVVYQGVATQYIVRLDGGDEFVVFAQNRMSAEDVAEEGEDVLCLWRAEHNVVLAETDRDSRDQEEPDD